MNGPAEEDGILPQRLPQYIYRQISQFIARRYAEPLRPPGPLSQSCRASGERLWRSPIGRPSLPANAETGIVAVGRDVDGNIDILRDASGHYPAEEWAQAALDLNKILEDDDHRRGGQPRRRDGRGGDRSPGHLHHHPPGARQPRQGDTATGPIPPPRAAAGRLCRSCRLRSGHRRRRHDMDLVGFDGAGGVGDGSGAATGATSGR